MRADKPSSIALVISLLFISTAPAQSLEVRKTYSGVPDNGSWDHFSGTADMNGGVAQCPAGSFVSGIQGFKSGNQPGDGPHLFISELRYTCEKRGGESHGIRKTFSGVPDSGSWTGFSGTADMNGAVAQCPAGSFVSGIQGFKSGEQQGDSPHLFISELRYTCKGSRGREAGIRKTYTGVPDGGSWSGFSGTLDVNSASAQCPTGSFVSGIQGFKSGNQPGDGPHLFISELRYTCNH